VAAFLFLREVREPALGPPAEPKRVREPALEVVHQATSTDTMLAVDGITDLPDGFQIEPKPKPVAFMRGLAIGLGTSTVLVLVLFVYLAVTRGKPIYLLVGVLFLVVAAASDYVLWRVLQPPVLRADSVHVTYSSGFQTRSVPRAELTMIFRGQIVQRSRYTAWVQSYIFGVGNGKVKFAAPALWFRPEDITAFAERLEIPVRGDFTQRVTGVINEAAN